MAFLQDIVKKNKTFLENNVNYLRDLNKDCNNFFKEIDNFLDNGDASFFKRYISGKENAEPVPTEVPTNKRREHQNKPALADITEVNELTSSVDIKKEKVSDIQDTPKESDVNIRDTNTVIKKEIEEMPAPTKLPPRKKKNYGERTDVVKRCTRSRTRTRHKDANEDASNSNKRNSKKISSDVIIQNPTITMIVISDGEKDTETESEVEKNTCEPELKTRSTRSKMRKQKQDSSKNSVNDGKIDLPDGENMRSTRTKTKQKKRVRSDSLEEPTTQLERKKSRSNSNTDQECHSSIRTEYEDAVSAIEDTENKKEDINITYVASNNLQKNNEQTVLSSLNSTIIVANPTIVINPREREELQKNVPENEGDQTEKVTPEPVKKTKGIKQVFSPYENTPLKKKVEAFEKLGAETSNIPMKLTRSKKKVQKKIYKSKEDKVEEEERQKSVGRSKAFTPIMSKFHPKLCSTSNINKLHPNYGNDTTITNESLLSVKSASALKASQAEFREREKRRQEKEREALRKRDALLQAQTEEKRRKREEKQQKAHQQREILEKEKQRQLEAQRIKEEKYKQVIAEKEEKLQKQREEAEKKRMMVKKKAIELKEKEVIKVPELRKITEMKVTLNKQDEMAKAVLKQKMERQHQHQSAPLYMTTRPPLLPTDDCYDSDDPEYNKHVRRNEPFWSRDGEVREQQMAMIVAGEKIKNSFFCRQTHSPDLQDIFEHIDPRKLKRTSSAIWRKAPRYTLMPTIADNPVFSEESDSC